MPCELMQPVLLMQRGPSVLTSVVELASVRDTWPARRGDYKARCKWNLTPMPCQANETGDSPEVSGRRHRRKYAATLVREL